MTYTRQLAQFASDLQYSDLPPRVVEKAKEIALHAFGVQLAGSTLPWSKAAYRFIRAQGGAPDSTVVNYGLKTSPMNAAFTNGTFAHSFEMDDNHGTSSIKGGCVVVPTVSAIGERELSSGREFILAAVIAYEVMTRIALSVTPSVMRRGFQPTAACGAFGAAAATGRLLRFDQETMLHAISIAGGHSGGLMEAPAAGRGELKRIYGGMAASNGIRSALLAREGLTGPETMLEGEHGFCHGFGDNADLRILTAGLGTEWQILEVHYKPYTQDGYIQPMTEALDHLVRTHKFGPDDVEEIRTGCCQFAHNHIVGVIQRPKDLASAQYSANFSLALFMLKGNAGFREYSEDSLGDPAIASLSRKVHTVLDDEVEQEWQKTRARGARVTVRLKSGDTVSHYVKNLRSMTPGELDEKFRRLASVAMNDEACERFAAVVKNLEDLGDVSRLVPRGRDCPAGAAGP